MAGSDNVTANLQTIPGGPVFRSLSDGTNEWPACVPAYVAGGSAGAWDLVPVGPSSPLPVATQLAAGTPTDHSSAPPAQLTTLVTILANANRRGLYVQNQSAGTIQVVLGTTIILIDPGAGANRQGGDWSFAQAGILYTGQILICGAAGSQVGAMEY